MNIRGTSSAESFLLIIKKFLPHNSFDLQEQDARDILLGKAKMRGTLFLLGFIVCLVSIGPVPVLLADSASGVFLTEVKGDVQIFKSGDVVGRKVQEGDVIQLQDKIQTGPDGSARISVQDTAEIKLGKETTWSLERFASESGKKEFSAYLALGRLRAKVKRLPNGSVFEMKTPTSVAAVRGTEFELFVYKFQGKIYTYLIVFKHAVQFSNLTGDQSYLVEGGYNATSSAEGVVTPPQSSGSATDKTLAVSDDEHIQLDNPWRFLEPEGSQKPPQTTTGVILAPASGQGLGGDDDSGP